MTFIARGENLRALRQKGLTVKSYQGDFHLERVHATDRPEEAGVCNLVLVCVKSYDTRDAARLIHPAVGAQTVTLSLQNGVENEEWLERTLGSAKVLGGLVYIGAALASPGVVEHSFSGALVFGERDGQRTPRVERLERVFLDAAIQAQLSSDITLMLWDKLIWNAAFNAITTLTRSTVGEVLAQPLTRALVRDTMLEVIAVAQAQGLPLQESRADEHIEGSQSPAMSLFTTSVGKVRDSRPAPFLLTRINASAWPLLSQSRRVGHDLPYQALGHFTVEADANPHSPSSAAHPYDLVVHVEGDHRHATNCR